MTKGIKVLNLGDVVHIMDPEYELEYRGQTAEIIGMKLNDGEVDYTLRTQDKCTSDGWTDRQLLPVTETDVAPKKTVRKVWRNVFKQGGQFDWLTLELAEHAVVNFGEKRFSRTLVPITITETEGHSDDD